MQAIFYQITISIHALLAESDAAGNKAGAESFKISIHALLAESDCSAVASGSTSFSFLSTLSLRRATYCYMWALADCTNFYPRSPCGERPERPVESRSNILISIHALLAESDPVLSQPNKPRHLFLSTLSLRRATVPCWALYSSSRYFYPRSPCGERQPVFAVTSEVSDISIHALLAESDG